ncbi:MAG TPA: hypothetical protein VGH14_16515 [Solirubrobacterales bacterium]|jgi:hypothetical protein
MIRQAHTYLVGALSGVVVIGIAIAAFVVLVSAQVFHDLPLPALSSSDQKAAAVSPGKAVTGSPDHQAVATTGVGIGTPQTNRGTTNVTPNGGGQNGATNSQPQAHHQGTAATPTQDATGPAEVVETTPTTSTGTGDEGSTSGGGNSGGSHSSQPSPNSSAPNSSPNTGGGSVGGGNSTSTSGSSGNGGAGNSTPTTTSGSSGAGPATGTSGGGTTTTSPPAAPVTTAKPSESLTEGVNGAVGTVNEATGGTLSEAGVTHVTEEVVKGVAGPESVVGKTVDGVGEVVGGLLGGSGK